MTTLILKATKFAINAHGKQTRKGSGMPYVIHVVGVAEKLALAGVIDEAVLCAALLHG